MVIQYLLETSNELELVEAAKEVRLVVVVEVAYVLGWRRTVVAAEWEMHVQ